MNRQGLYIIRASGDGWAVHLDDETLATFEERPEAIQAAIVVAESSGRFGRPSGVFSLAQSGQLLPIWQVGRDAYSKLM
jgi:hypothetical protein